MADTQTKKVIAAVVARLNEPDKPAGVVVNKNRTTEVEKDELPMYSVYVGTESVQGVGGTQRRPAMRQRELELVVKIRVVGDDDAADVHRAYVESKLCGDPSLGGLVINVEPVSVVWDTEEASDGSYLAEERHYKVEYTTANADLTRKA